MEDLLRISAIRHAWPERNSDFMIDRPHGIDTYVFIHLWNSVDMVIGGKTIRTEPSACVIYDKTYPQKWKPLPGGIIHDWIHIHGDLPSLISDANLEFNKIYYPKSPAFITAITEELELEHFAGKKHSERLCDIKLRELFYRISRRLDTDEPERPPDADTAAKLKALRNEIFSDLSCCPTVSEMAKRLSVSESKFYVVYKEVFGISPTKDIINARIENAKIYLSSGLYSVEQTAELVGYKNPFHFIRQFKQITGKTPGKFLK
ncbi:MAG: helix-turn-helix transcriptional regulator [Clostridia bacterium]|nr:helix-turn-helix transcriptional regulator [Clostridia bacterium]